jgi:hypothetical protein
VRHVARLVEDLDQHLHGGLWGGGGGQGRRSACMRVSKGERGMRRASCGVGWALPSSCLGATPQGVSPTGGV